MGREETDREARGEQRRTGGTREKQVFLEDHQDDDRCRGFDSRLVIVIVRGWAGGRWRGRVVVGRKETVTQAR